MFLIIDNNNSVNLVPKPPYAVYELEPNRPICLGCDSQKNYKTLSSLSSMGCSKGALDCIALIIRFINKVPQCPSGGQCQGPGLYKSQEDC